MRKVKIAIIDSGVRVDHPALKKNEPQIVRFSGLNGYEGRCGHGTAIYNIIKKTEKFADIINFQITNIDEEIEKGLLLSCLQKINDEYKVDIINISLGISICDDIVMLRRICNELSSKGIVIVSAFDNLGSISYPAAFDNVIGVSSSEACRKASDFIVVDDSVINICAHGNIQRLAWDSPDYIVLNGNSFACAHVTVQIARFMSEGIFEFSKIMDKFKEIALQTLSDKKKDYNTNELFEIDKAAIFPFNKEMHSLIRFYDQISFEIVGVYEMRESSRVGSTTDHVMKSNVKSFLIKNVKEIEWDTFDTLIVGNMPFENSDILSKVRDNIVEQAILLGKKVFSFDDLRNKFNYKFLYSPVVDDSVLPPKRFGKLYRINKPVIGIYGTSSSQGKYTLQLELRRLFLEQGYNVGQIGTEPSSMLFGMDYAYPMGFNSSVYIDGHDTVRYLNDCIHQLCERNCDIVITGSQASVLPEDIGNLRMFPLKQYSFLMGTQPDGVILCINPDDDIDYIRRTIAFLEASVDGRVIALCVYPMKYKNDWTGIYNQKEELTRSEFNKLKTVLSNEFSIGVFQLGKRNDAILLFNSIVSFFSNE